jgi:membrane protein required for colicin V production
MDRDVARCTPFSSYDFYCLGDHPETISLIAIGNQNRLESIFAGPDEVAKSRPVTVLFTHFSGFGSMQIYDIVMIVVLVGAMFFGAVKGFAWQLASIASIVVSYFVALKFREPFSQSIALDPPLNRLLAMLILYVATALLVWVVFRMVSQSIDRLRLKEFDRHIGAVFGLIKGGLYCVLLTLFAVTLAGEQIRETVVSSKSGHYIADVLDRSESVIPPEIHGFVDPYLRRFEQQFNQPAVDGLQGSGAPGPAAAQFAAEARQPIQNWAPESALTAPAQSWVPQQAQQQGGSFQR